MKTEYWILLGIGAAAVVAIFLLKPPPPVEEEEPSAWWKCDEGSGIQLADSSGNDNTATGTNISWQTTSRGTKPSFNGNDSFFVAPVNQTMQVYGSSGFTVMAWVYAKSAGGGNFGRIIDHNRAWGICEGPGYSLFTTDETVDGVRIGWTVTGDKLDLGYSDVAYAKTAARYPLNTWHHVIGTFNEDGNKRVKIYINGNPVELTDEFQMQGNIQDDTNVEMGIGAFVGGDKTPYYLESFDGYLDDIKIYKTAQVPLSALPVRTALSLIPVKQFKTSLKPFPLGMKQV